MKIVRIVPRPSEEEAAVIVAALQQLARSQQATQPRRSRWVETARQEALDAGV